MPPNLVDWLLESHRAWFVIDTVAEMDISAFHERAARCRDGRDRRNTAGAASNPDVTGVVLDQDQALASAVAEFGTLLQPIDHELKR